MSSTQNKNNVAEYLCSKKQNNKINNYMINNIYSEQNNNTRMFDLGALPSKVNASNFSHNHVDLESKLRGIRACDLENGNFNPSIKEKQTNTTTLFENHLKTNVYLPPELAHNSKERFGFHNI